MIGFILNAFVVVLNVAFYLGNENEGHLLLAVTWTFIAMFFLAVAIGERAV